MAPGTFRLARFRAAWGERTAMAEKRTGWIWERLRKKSRKELDKLEQDLVRRPGEKREYAGDPNQPRHFWVKTRNK